MEYFFNSSLVQDFKLNQNPQKMKTILLPTDFSKCAEVALSYAAHLAVTHNAKLILQSVFWVPVYENDTSKEIRFKEDRFRNAAKTSIQEVQTSITEKYPSLKVEFVISNGFLADSIIHTAKQKHVDLIIMGTKGASGLQETILGSNTADVMDRAQCPILTIPENAEWNDLGKVLFCMDYQESDLEELKDLVEKVKRFGSEIVIGHVASESYTPEGEAAIFKAFKELVRERIKYQPISFKMMQNDPAKEAIQKYAKSHKIDLLVISQRKRNWFQKFFDKGLSKDMVFHSQIPVLIYKTKTVKHLDNLHSLIEMSEL